ncbi:unnamed protein product [Mycena citricolor]|uniref:Uncharacterized protein n=1 Tax=Mycena citricolor TaxID=2018698 RepID=A0AAD2HDI2_9AGAR|nr:unnamed protein product [Mycena citricolor]
MKWPFSQNIKPASDLTPILPPELERYIFELYALESASPERILHVLPVCRRVRTWLEPCLFRTIIFNDGFDNKLPSCELDTIQRASEAYPGALEIVVTNVLLIGERQDTVELVMRTCAGVKNLFFSGSKPEVFDLSPSLRRLHCGLEVFDFSTGITFPLLTHLELFNIGRNFGTSDSHPLLVESETLLPNLTHLAFSVTTVIRMLPDIVSCFTSLEALVIVSTYRVVSSTPLLPEERRVFEDDCRIVLVSVSDYIVDWQEGVLSGEDYWTRADRRIVNRQSGEVDASKFAVNFNDSD